MQTVTQQQQADGAALHSHADSNSNNDNYVNQYFGSGGATLAGSGESTSADEFTGSSRFSWPLPVTQARGTTPSLALSYQAGIGHSPFGMGVDFAIPSISRRTSGVGIPTYTEQDAFVFNGQQLVPELDDQQQVSTQVEVINGSHYQVQSFLLRDQTTPIYIQFLVNNSDANDCFWRVRDSDDSQMIFGRSALARITNPNDASQVFSWQLEEVVDSKHNHQRWYYQAEDSQGVNNASGSVEANHQHSANRYLTRIAYGNSDHPEATPYTLMASEPMVNWLFEIVLDYGEHNLALTNTDPYSKDKGQWQVRQDSYSHYRMGFEVRTHRLCRNILLFHRFDELSTTKPVLVKRWRLEHQHSKRATQLAAITPIGLIYQPSVVGQPYRSEIMPPIELGYQAFRPTGGQFTELKAKDEAKLPGLSQGRYQLVDLFQQGIASAVYRDDNTLYYRQVESVTRDDQQQYQLRYGALEQISTLPTSGGKGLQLTNITAEGKIELVEGKAGKAGFYQATGDGDWRSFIPFDAFPSEYGQKGALFADVTGDGTGDVVLIGPKSVRFYANKGRKGYSAPVENKNLPSDFPTSVQGQGNAVIGFSDLLGSGQPHLFRILHNKVEVWPNLGYGKFADKIEMANPPDLDDASFTPEAVFLADIDGSGSSDFIYVDGNKAKVYLNQSGNGFAAPFEVTLPAAFDSINQVSFADVFGCGSAALVFTVTSPEVRHYAYDFSQGQKPYLLSFVNNNQGKNTRISYGSSVHEYLADKMANKPWVSSLPLPIQVVKSIAVTDEVNQLTLASNYRYHHGFYDFSEKQYRGFGRVDVTELERNHNDLLAASAPLHKVNWFHTGSALFDDSLSQLQQEFYQADKQATPLANTLYEANGLSKTASIEQFKINANRAMAGVLLRSELYGMEQGEKRPHPYQVNEWRYRLEHRQSAKDQKVSKGSVQRKMIETISYNYDQKPQDPNVKHQINRQFDSQGYLTDSIDIVYPRRHFSERAYHDPSQDKLLAVRKQYDYSHEKQSARLLTGYKKQANTTELQNLALPAGQGRFSYENLSHSLISAAESEVLAQARYFYAKPGTTEVLAFGQVRSPALLSHVETTAYDKAKLTQLLVTDDKLFANASELDALLTNQGKFTTTTSDNYWWQSSGKTQYGNNHDFYQAQAHINAMGNTTRLAYDKYNYQVTKITNPFSNETKAQWNYRCMAIAKLTDINENDAYYQYDAFARQLRYSYRGKESGKTSGFAGLSGEPQAVSANQLLNDGVNQVADSAKVQAYADYAWMPRLTSDELAKELSLKTAAIEILRALLDANWLTSELHVRAKVYQMIDTDRFVLPPPLRHLSQAQQAKLKALLSGLKRQPVHQVSVGAEQYSAGRVGLSTVRTGISYLDGFGRLLQQKAKVEPGDAFIIDNKGEIVMEQQQPKVLSSDHRWLTSGRVVLNNKGLPVRQYEPYYLNTSQYIRHTMVDQFGVSSTQYYDALGRVTKLVSAKGFVTQTEYSPWYQRDFDQNDTLLSSPYYQANLNGSVNSASEYYDKEVVNNVNQQSAAFSEVSKLAAIESRKATLSAVGMTDTPTTMIFDGLAHLVAKIRLDQVVVEANTFATIFPNTAQQNDLLQWLKAQGIVTAQHTLASNFNRQLDALPSQLSGKQAQIQAKLTELDTKRKFQSQMTYHIQGQVLTEQDARLKTKGHNNSQNTLNLSAVVKTSSVDKGTMWHLNNAQGQPIWQHDARSHTLLFSYDEAQRLTYLKEKTASAEKIREKYVYGDSLSADQRPQDRNLRGKRYQSYSQAGLQQATLGYNIKGSLLSKESQPVKAYKTQVDWPETGDASNLLDSNELQTVSNRYNALEQVLQTQRVSRTSAMTYTTEYQYYSSSRLAKVKHQASGNNEQVILSDVVYAANGLVQQEKHSGLISQYDYDPKSLKLQRVVSKRGSDNRIERDQRWAYDPVGNVKLVLNVSAVSRFNYSNQAKPETRYQYDALYRLTSASGRKQLGGIDSKTVPAAVRLSSSSKADVTSYTQRFEYDKGHNMTKVSMLADSNHSTEFFVADDSNRSTVAPAQTAQLNAMYDAQGNQIKWSALDSEQKLFWDHANRLQKVVLVERSGNKDDAEYYQYDEYGQRLRKVTERYASDLNTINVEQVLYYGAFEIRTKGSRPANSDTVTNSEVLHIDTCLAGEQGQSRFYKWLAGKPAQQQNEQYRTSFTSLSRQAQMDFSERGELIAFIEYLPFGGTALHSTDKDSDVKLKHYRHSGKERDATGLYYYGHRYYAPWQMRWVSADPAGNVDGLNLYAYVQNNPCTYFDADGLSAKSTERRESSSSLDANASEQSNNDIEFDDIFAFTEELTEYVETGGAASEGTSEQQQDEQGDEQEQAEYLITQIVSTALNNTAETREKSVKTIRSAYRALERLANSEDLSAEQLGQAFKNVAKNIVAAKDKTEIERDITQRAPSEEDRLVLGRNFDQINGLSADNEAVTQPEATVQPTTPAEAPVSVADVELTVETIETTSIQAIAVETQVAKNDVSSFVRNTPIRVGLVGQRRHQLQAISRERVRQIERKAMRNLAGTGIVLGNTKRLIERYETRL